MVSVSFVVIVTIGVVGPAVAVFGDSGSRYYYVPQVFPINRCL